MTPTQALPIITLVLPIMGLLTTSGNFFQDESHIKEIIPLFISL